MVNTLNYIPKLARYEWHPFTIANAPNLEGKVVFYIKAAGRWTSALYELFLQDPVKGGDLPIAYVGVSGSYGASAQAYLAYGHILVIASGLGVTPLLSIWQHFVSALHFPASRPEMTVHPSTVLLQPDYKRLEEYHDVQNPSRQIGCQLSSSVVLRPPSRYLLRPRR